jgi:hypothetical protein
MLSTVHSIVLKPGPARRVDLADPGLEPGRVEEKIGEGKIRSKTRLQPINFFFLLKRRRFNLYKKKLTQPT